VHLDLAHQGLHRLVTGFELEIQQTVRLAGAQHDVERLAIEHHRPRRLALAIDDPRNLGHGAQLAGRALAMLVAQRDRQRLRTLHRNLDLRTLRHGRGARRGWRRPRTGPFK